MFLQEIEISTTQKTSTFHIRLHERAQSKINMLFLSGLAARDNGHSGLLDRPEGGCGADMAV
jgi:hypothetical protein